MRIPKEITGNVNAGDRSQVEQFARDASRLIQTARLSLVWGVGALAAGSRSFTLHVVNRNLARVPGYKLVTVWMGPTATGTPAGAQTFTLTTGTIINTILADRAYVLMTNADGALGFDVAAAAAQVRVLSAAIVPEVIQTDVVAW